MSVKGEIFIVIFAGFGVGRGKGALSAITEVCKEGIHASHIFTCALLWMLREVESFVKLFPSPLDVPI